MSRTQNQKRRHARALRIMRGRAPGLIIALRHARGWVWGRDTKQILACHMCLAGSGGKADLHTLGLL